MSLLTAEASSELSRFRERNEKLQGILEAAKQLGSERNIDRLLERILGFAKDIIGCDRCSLFIVDHEREELWSKIAQGSVNEIRFPMGKGIAGQCAATRTPILIQDVYADPRFNPDVDKSTGYRTRNILTVPMLDADSLCTGVIQALNKAGERDFTEEDQDLLLALGGQAAVAVENALLHLDIERLFEGFIKASVYAIEARDPTTSGHSERVAILTVGVADAVNREPPPSHRHVHFSDEELRELRYAALLHDFGKVGVREHVLVKANKLYPHELELLEHRFGLAKKDAEARFLRDRVRLLEPAGLHGEACEQCEALEKEETRVLTELEELWQFVLTCNRPTVLEEGSFERLHEVAGRTFPGPRGDQVPLLGANEVVNLSISRGSLNADERAEIESHVTHTYRFLKQIPWTRDLRRVPEIAYKHHEKLDGKGYPASADPPAIPVQTRIMTIADIYDALTTSDRPYKKAMPHERALDILHMDAKKGSLDAELLEVFVASEVHKKLKTPEPT
jgi:HD-GYP domain-containing protein (c-di-GMP phosphodiesterase class II)